MEKPIQVLLFILFFHTAFPQQLKIRNQIDAEGYASNNIQMDSLISRISQEKYAQIYPAGTEKKVSENTIFRVAICPHDDYTYAGRMYTKALKNIKAKIVIIFGVAHKVKIKDKLIFEDFDQWKSAYGNVKISPIREQIIQGLPLENYKIDDSIHLKEHSVEAIVPFLQYYNRKVEIIPILVSNMSVDSMPLLAKNLADVLQAILVSQKLQWGKDVAIVISNDAVHYGDEGWGGKNYAFFGSDSAGYTKALLNENRLIQQYLIPELNLTNISSFASELVNQNSIYKWTWCGRNTIPFGLLTSLYLQENTGTPKLTGIFLGYSTSIMNTPIKVDDLKMGATAPANMHHWVGYAAIGYK
jgi:AmmeMemoRadiSam system protein B